MNQSVRVVVAGHLCLDLTPEFLMEERVDIDKLFIPGKLLNVGKINISTGGPVSNTGIALSILGINTSLMAKIGDDFFGRGIKEQLAKWDLDLQLRIMPEVNTSYTVALVPKGMDRIFLHCPSSNDTFNSDDIDYDKIAQANLFHFGYPPLMRGMYENGGSELIKIFKRVKSLGIVTSLDMSLPDTESDSAKADWEKILQELLPYVDIFLPSIEESAFMVDQTLYKKMRKSKESGDMLTHLNLNDLPSISKTFLDMGAKIVALKCGVKGFSIRTASEEILNKMQHRMFFDPHTWANRELHEESFYVPNVKSATGSGDSSIAGFLSAFLRGLSIEETIRTACAVGGENVAVLDAISGIKSWDDTQRLIRDGWNKNKLEVSGDYWHYDEIRKVWIGKEDNCK